jgi:hypothetical protein
MARRGTEQVLALDSARELLAALPARRHSPIDAASVQQAMFHDAEHLKIDQVVVGLVCVAVVYLKAGWDRAVRLLPDVTMFRDTSSVHANDAVSLAADVAAFDVARISAPARAELAATPFDLTGASRKRGSAPLASNGNGGSILTGHSGFLPRIRGAMPWGVSAPPGFSLL